MSVIGDVSGAEFVVGNRDGAGEIRFGGGAGVGDAAAGEGLDIGGGGDEEQRGVGVAHAESITLERDGAAGWNDAETGGVAHAGGAFEAVVQLTAHEQAVGVGGLGGEAFRAVEAGVEGDAAGRAGGEAENKSLGRRADKGFAGVAHAVLFVVEATDGLGEVEGASVVFDLGGDGRGEREAQVAQRLVAAERRIGPRALAGAFAGAGEVRVHEGFGLVVFALEQQAADLGQHEVGVGSVGVLGRAGPHPGFVEHDALLSDATVKRGAEPAVAQRGGFEEIFAGRGQDDKARLVARGGGEGERQTEQEGEKSGHHGGG